jgi:hypothetical protein
MGVRALDVPVPNDYDDDGVTDTAVWRPSTGEWWVVRSSDGATVTTQWGVSTDVPLAHDYDGDGKPTLPCGGLRPVCGG